MKEIKFSCMWFNEKKWMDLRYTLEEMENGDHWEALSDQPLLRGFMLRHKRQYTGLKDKNGVEIYEGDIVKTVFDLAKRKRHIGEIYFQPTRLNWSVKHSVFANQDLFVYTRPDRSIEVIGNIYENPELLL